MSTSFQQVQTHFCQWIRQPTSDLSPVVQGVAVDRMQVYRELLYNNVVSFIDSVFPVAQSLLSEQEWAALQHDFFSQARCKSPFYMDISKEFLEYLQSHQSSITDKYPWLLELLHVEWMELQVELAEFEWPDSAHFLQLEDINNLDDHCALRCSVPIWVLGYQWRVYEWQIAHDVDGELPEPSFLLVWCDADDDRCQQVIAPLYALLIDHIAQQQIFDIDGLKQLLNQHLVGISEAEQLDITNTLFRYLVQFNLLSYWKD